MKCPSQAKLGRAFSKGADAQLTAHLDACGICAARWRGFAQLRALAQRLPEPALDADTRDALRAALVGGAAAARGRSRRWALIAVAALGIVGTLVAGGISLLGRPALRGEIRALPGAIFEHVGPASDERVVLHDGTVAVEVSPLRPAERFCVVTGDAEVEVRGTAFEVVASGDRLLAVRVSHGRVEVRPATAAATTLAAGETWTRPAQPTPPVASAPPAPMPPVATVPPPPPPRPHAHPTAPASKPEPARPNLSQPSPTEVAFDEGFAALRAGAHDAAALAFGRAASGGGELAEDATFWQAVALRRAGRPGAALTAFVTFLDRYPRSPRAGEAAVAAGWLELDAGRSAAAATHFRAAVDDPAPRVRASAADGLRAVTAK